MRTAHGSALAILLVGLATAPCRASRIALKIDPTSRFRPGAVTVTVKLTNLGDEPARLVWTEALVGQSSARSEPVESLGVNETTVATLEVEKTPPDPGIYTIVIKAHGTDMKGHPFTALKSIPLIAAVPDENEKEIITHLSILRLKKEGETVLHVSAPPDTGIQGTATLILPDALSCPNPTHDINIDPGGAADIPFRVHKRFARPRSRYLVLAVVDYSYNGRHRSTVAQGSVSIEPHPEPFAPEHRKTWLTTIAVLFAVFIAAQFVRRPAVRPALTSGIETAVAVVLLLCITVFLFHHIPPALLVSDTVTVGGDTPAHNYMASHLRENLFEHGRVVSWSNDWWCGFPMFQFYFCLPYLLMAFLSLVMPLTVALKIVSVAGILLLPWAAWLAGRIMRLPKPAPALLAVATLPVLFDPSNTMWGVNIYSTLAGMIANSISFPLMILFLACAVRDTEDGKFRLRTCFLLAAVAASHFFTLIIACIAVMVIPFLHGRGRILSSITVLIRECGLGLLLMSWWFVPLAVKHQYSVDFGVNWPDTLLPRIAQGYLPLVASCVAVVALAVAVAWRWAFLGIVSHILLASSLLFLFGYESICRVFQNIRFWPFMTYSVFAMGALIVAAACRRAKARPLAVAALLLLTMLYGTDQPNHVRSWAEWNYEGLQGKARWPVFGELLIPRLRDTPGRLANDLHPDNDSLGSSRIFECVPCMIDKPVLEGGIVNSAAGSIYSYYVQGETSENTAGFPNIVQPTTFNFTNATRHLALFNVKHFIARWEGTKKALTESTDWRLLGECQGWELHELTTHNGSYVFVPRNDPVPVRLEPRGTPGREWKEAGLEWMYNITSVDQHYILIMPGQEPPEGTTAINQQQFVAEIRPARGEKKPSPPPPAEGIAADVTITDETVSNHSISFRTSSPGRPHIIKCTYYPNWKIKGAKQVYMVTPCFMLVYPDAEEVELYYGYTLSDNIGRAISGLAALLVVAVLLCRLRRRAKAARQEAAPEQKDQE